MLYLAGLQRNNQCAQDLIIAVNKLKPVGGGGVHTILKIKRDIKIDVGLII